MLPSSIAAWVKPPCGKAGPRSLLSHDRPPEAHSPGPRDRRVRTEQVGIAAARRHGGEQEERHDSSVPSHDRGRAGDRRLRKSGTSGNSEPRSRSGGYGLTTARPRRASRSAPCRNHTHRASRGRMREHARRSIYAENNRAESRRKLFRRMLRKILVSCASHRTKRSRHFHNLHSTNAIRRTRTA